MAEILSGIPVAEQIKSCLRELRDEISGEPPCLMVIRFGNNADDISYQRSAEKICGEFGVRFLLTELAEDESLERFIEQFDKINRERSIDGIILMGSYPSQAVKEHVQKTIDPRKDVDGIAFENIAKLCGGDKDAVIPCTAESVIRLLDYYNIALAGKKICVLGRSLVIGKPVALGLMNRNATVTVCHSKTKDMETETKQADIIVSSIGTAKFLNQNHVTPSSIVIDVGINFDENNKLCGDADFSVLQDIVRGITPVPKGIGSITNAVLVSHIYASYHKKIEEIT